MAYTLHNGFTVVIPTPRLVLREFQESDWMRVFEYQSTSRFARFSGWDRRSEADAQNFVNRFMEWQSERPRTRYQLAVILRAEQRMIGNLGIRSTRELIDGEIGFELDEEYWGRGYATEAAKALLHFAFSGLKLCRVRAQCVVENQASAKVMRRLGMRYERTEQSSIWMKERWWDTDQFSLAKEDWMRRPALDRVTAGR